MKVSFTCTQDALCPHVCINFISVVDSYEVGSYIMGSYVYNFIVALFLVLNCAMNNEHVCDNLSSEWCVGRSQVIMLATLIGALTCIHCAMVRNILRALIALMSVCLSVTVVILVRL